MLQIIYLSRAHDDLSDGHLADLVAQASQRNQQIGVTGALYYGGGFFVQAIEGEDASVMRLYARILDDPRHEEVQLLSVRPLRERFFPSWGMGLVPNAAEAPETQTALRIAMACGEVWNDKDFDEILDVFRSSLQIEARPAEG